MGSFSEAVKAYKNGDFRKAEQACRAELSRNASNPQALNLLGAIAGGAGQHQAAAELMLRAVRLAPGEVSFRCNLVTALLAQGRLEEAERAVRAGLDLAPDDPSLNAIWGVVRGRQGHAAESVAALERAVQLNPQSATARFNLAEAYRQADKPAAAVAEFRQTLELAPDHADALNNLAGMLVDQTAFHEAITCFERLLKLRPRSAQVYSNLGVALRAVGDVDQAIAAFRHAVRLAPDVVAPRFQLANLLIAQGEIEAGDRLLAELAESAPDNMEFLASRARLLERQGRIEEAAALIDSIDPGQLQRPSVALARAIVLEQQGRVEEAIEIMLRIADSHQLLLEEGSGVRFRLAKFYDRAGEFDQAFTQFQLANAKRRATLAVPYSVKTHTARVDALTRVLEPETFAQRSASKLIDAKPIFIVGMPRSGTSLVEQILDSHTDVHGCGELSYLGDAIRATHADAAGGQPVSGSDDVAELVRSFLPACWQDASSAGLEELGASYLHRVRELAGEAPRTTDKMPYNFFYLAVIHKTFPNATILHCRRHPLDTCVSCYFQEFLLGHEYTYDLRDLGSYYRGYQRVMSHWETLGIPICHIDYEQLVAEPEAEVRRILAYSDLAWQPSCLDFHKSSRIVNTASYQQIRQPIYTKSAGRWRNYEKHLGPLMEELNTRAREARD